MTSVAAREIYLDFCDGRPNDGAPLLARAAVRENGILVEYEEYSGGLREGDIYCAASGDYVRNLNSCFPVLHETGGGSPVKGCLRVSEPPASRSLLVQIVSVPGGTKACRLTDRPKISGRYAVLIMNSSGGNVFISKKLSGPESKNTASRMAEGIIAVFGAKLSSSGYDVLLRTASASVSSEEVNDCVKELLEKADAITVDFEEKARNGSCGLVFALSRADRLLNCYRADTVNAIYTESGAAADMIMRDHPEFRNIVHVTRAGAFERSGIIEEYSRISGRTVRLPSGGNIIIDVTEAMTVIDVNSASGTTGRNRRELILNTNLEAASEISRQLRLRNLTGIIVCDLINMDRVEDEEAVITRMRSLLAPDPSKTEIFGFTRLKMLEISRSAAR